MSISILWVLREHLLISLVPWLVGVIAGGSLGYACALTARSLFSAFPSLRSVSMLLPWRVFAVTVPLLSPLIPVVLGLGTLAGATMVALLVLLVALPFTASTLLEHWYPSPLGVRLISGFRSLAAASVAVGTWIPMVAGSGGAGVLIFREGWQLLDYSLVLRGLCVVALLALVADVLLGVLQCLLGRAPVKALGHSDGPSAHSRAGYPN
jgi:ABC-type proline/glycine betaine transport system permease subunit